MASHDREHTHQLLMKAICQVILDDNKPLVLKGGTALLLCYELDRFSEDLDFDLERSINGHLNVESICRQAVKLVNKVGLQIRLVAFAEPKKTETTHRCRPSFEIPGEPLPISIKIEISSRKLPAENEVAVVNGVKVYHVNTIARQKLLAAMEHDERPYRTAARDLHDLAFVARQFESELTEDVVADLEAFFSEPAQLLERYSDAYEMDPILFSRLFEDLSVIEKWMHERGEPEALALFGEP